MPSQEEIEAALLAQQEQERQAAADAAAAATAQAAAEAAAAQARADAEAAAAAAAAARQATGDQISDRQHGRNITKLTNIIYSKVEEKANDSAEAQAVLKKVQEALDVELENQDPEIVARWIANPDLCETYVSWGLGELVKVGAVKAPRQSEAYTPPGGGSGGSAVNAEVARLERQYGKEAVAEATQRIKGILPEGSNPRLDEVSALLKESR